MANRLNFSRGLENNLPTPVDGTVRFCTDTGSLYIDNNEERIKINAGKADQLTEKRTISLTGAVTGAVEFDGSTDVTMNTMSAMESTQLIEDSEIAYSKDLPVANVSKYATITEIGGMSYKCENLIPFPYNENTKTKNGITFTVNNDGSVLANGTADENYNVAFYLCENVMFSAGNYVLSGVPSGFKSEVTITLYYKDDSGEYIYVNVYSGGNITFTLTTSRQCTIYLQVFKGQSVSNLTFYPMLNKGDTALPYEPYFEGLRDAKVTAIESNSINMCNLARIPDTLNGLTFAKNTDGSITINGTCNAYTTIYFDKINIKTGEKFYFLGGQKGTIFTFNGNMGGTFIKNLGTADATVVQTVECDGTYDIFYPILLIQEGTVLSNVTVCFMASKTPFTSFSPYFKNTFSIPEAVQALDGYGQGINEQYYNKIVLDPASGVKKFVKNTSKRVLTGTEAWYFYKVNDHGAYVYQATFSDKKPTEEICCSHFNYNRVAWDLKGVGYASGHPTLQNIYFNTSSATLDEWKAYLAEQYVNGTPVIVEYVLVTPIETDISAYFVEDNLIGIESGGTVTAVNEYKYDVPFTINYSYGKNYDVVSSKKFIGDLDGIATRAISDNNGNIIEKTYIPLTGGTFAGPIATKPNQYMENSLYGLNMNNSDIVGINGLYFGDVADGSGEGFMFKRSDNNYDQLYAEDGKLYFTTGSTPSAFGVKNTVLHSGNYSSYALPLHGIADTATKLATARTISLGGNMSGSIDFDGSGNKSFSAKIGKEWTAITTVGAYSRLCLLSGYSNWILSIQLSQSSQVSYHTYLIGIGYESGNISQISNTGYTTYSNQVIRLGRNNATSAFVEIFNNYGYNSTTTVNCVCKLIPLSESATLNAQTYYTTYTAGESTSTVWAEITSQGKGIVSSTFYGNLTGNATTATTANKVIDSNNGREITINYSADALSNPTWLAGWNGYELRGVNRNDLSVNYATSAGSATSATKLATARTISLTGDVTGSTTFDGSGNVSITATVVDDSHNHTMNTITNATTKYVNAGTVTRKVIVNEGKNSQGYISRVALGLSNPANAFSPALLSVGTNDAGTSWTDFTFGIDGSISSPKGSFVVSSGNIDTSSKPLGFSTRQTSISWGTLADSSYTCVTRWDTANGGSVAFADKDGQTSVQIDGNFYQNEGNYKVLDTSTGLQLTGGTMSGSIITPKDDNKGIIPHTDNWGQIGSAEKKFFRMYASTFYGNLSGTATKATQDGDGNTIASTYLKLSGGTLSGKLTASGKISVPSSGSSWVSGMTLNNASIAINTQNTDAAYHPIMAGKLYGGGVWNLGTITNKFGFYGFVSGHGSNNNYTDYYMNIDGTTGKVEIKTYNTNAPLMLTSPSNETCLIDFYGAIGHLGSIGFASANGSLVRWNSGGSATYTILDSSNYSSYALPLSGGTLTGPLNTANGTYNKIGDDVSIGDINMAGTLGIIGQNGNTAIQLVNYGASTTTGISATGVKWTCTGDGTSTISGTTSGTFAGNFYGNYTGSVTTNYIKTNINLAASDNKTSGWYRIWTGLGSNTSASYCIFNISRSYNSPQNEQYTFSVNFGYNGDVDITQLSGVQGSPLIKKIRAVYKDSGNVYIDIYIQANTSYSNTYYVSGFGFGNFQAPTLISSLESGYSAYEFTTATGCKSARGFMGNFTGDLAGTATAATYVNGYYTGNGGQVGPNSIGTHAVKFNMMNGFTGTWASSLNYMDCILMNCYAWADVPYATAIGVTKTIGAQPQMFVANGGNSGSWSNVVEVITSANIGAQTVSNSDKLDGYHGSASPTANTYILRDSSNYIWTNYIHSDTVNNENPAIGQVIVTNGSDGFYRKASLSHLKSSLGNMPASYAVCHDVRGVDRAPTYYTDRAVTAWFNETGTPWNGNWFSGLTVKGWSDGYCSWQLSSYSSTGTTDDCLYYRMGTPGGAWQSWRQIPTIKTITGSGAIGTITVANNTEYRYTGVTSLGINYPSGNFECWLRITVGSSAISLSFASGTSFIGTGITSLTANTSYEISIKDKVVIIKKVG